MAKFIPSDLSKPEREVHPKGKQWTLEEFQAYCGGFVEFLRLSDGRVLLIHEEAKILPDANKDINLRANSLVLGMIQLDDEIVGDALLLTPEEFADDP